MNRIIEFRKIIGNIFKKNILVILLIVFLCPILGFSYSSFVINTSKYKATEMYIGKLLYSIKIDNISTNQITVEPGETEAIIDVTGLNDFSTNFKLTYTINPNISVIYATDENQPTYGLLTTSIKASVLITNNSEESITISFDISGGYINNEIDTIAIKDGYTEVVDNYMKFDYETLALFVDGLRVESLDSSKAYNLVSYTCTNNEDVIWDNGTHSIKVLSANSPTKCQLRFEETIWNIADSYSCANGSNGVAPYIMNYTGDCTVLNSGNNSWKVYFNTSGNLTIANDYYIDVFLVGGGGGGSGGGNSGSGRWGGGGGGGYTNTQNYYHLNRNTEYAITVGAGGNAGVNASGGNGGTSSAFDFSATGGFGGAFSSAQGGAGGAGGSGGGAASSGNGGSNGSNGANANASGGLGQGTTTCEFGQGTIDGCAPGILLYSGGGGGGWNGGAVGGNGGGGACPSSSSNGVSGVNGLGGGGGAAGGTASTGGAGGSGIVVIKPAILTTVGNTEKFTFSYNAYYTVENPDTDNWKIKMYDSGNFISINDHVTYVDAFLVGGGGGGSGGGNSGSGKWGGGGGGGYTTTLTSMEISNSGLYTFIVGKGGTAGRNASGGRGGDSTAFSYSALGGYGGIYSSGVGGAGGSGGGGASGGAGGSYGNAGESKNYAGGNGQGTTTCEFGEGTLSGCDAGVTVYSGGGGGGWNGGGAGGAGGGGACPSSSSNGVSGVNGLGGGGGAAGGTASTGGAGGSGLIILRKSQ